MKACLAVIHRARNQFKLQWRARCWDLKGMNSSAGCGRSAFTSARTGLFITLQLTRVAGEFKRRSRENVPSATTSDGSMVCFAPENCQAKPTVFITAQHAN